MARTAIYVHRFMSSNGVGNAAIALYEDLISDGDSVDVFCMRSDAIYQKSIGVHKFPIRVPYSLEVVFLPIWSSIFSYRYRTIHSFEVPSPSCTFFHLHFDLSIKKDGQPGWSLRKFLRLVASKVSENGLQNAIRKKSVIIVPSELLANNLRKLYARDQLSIRVLPNRLSISELSLIEDLSRVELNVDSFSTLDLRVGENQLGLIAHGDFFYKGMGQIDDLFTYIPSNCSLLVIGGSNPPLIESRYRGRVSWLPTLDRAELFRHYRKMVGVFVASPFESFSMVALEAISFGLPVFFLGNAGIQEYYEEFSLQSNSENLIFTHESQQDWVSCISKPKCPQPEFNQYLVTLRSNALIQLRHSRTK